MYVIVCKGSLSPLSEEFITGWSAVRMAALKALVKYSCAPAHYGSSYNLHIELISDLVRLLSKESNQTLCPVNLQMVITNNKYYLSLIQNLLFLSCLGHCP